MCTRFLYVDGENLSKEGLIDSVNSFKSSLDENDFLIGKLYGAKEMVKNKVPFCLLNGLSYVETSTITMSSKNVADMKITVDCICDALTYLKKNEDFTVTILSKDCDFLPLVFKLKELGINVDMPFFNLSEYSSTKKTTAELDAYLKCVKFYSNQNSNCVGNMFDEILRVLDESYPVHVIEDHIQFRTRKFISAIKDYFGNEEARSLNKIAPQDFSLAQVIKVLGYRDKTTLDEIYILYVSKIYGFIPKKKSIPENVLRELGLRQNLQQVV